MAATIRDVAKKANVSIATVSRYLNDSPSISDDATKKIKKAINDLGYNPFKFAKGFVKKSMKTIGLLLPDINNIYYYSVIKGVEDELEKQGYNIFICITDENIE